MGNIEFWVVFVIGNLIKLQKMVLEGKNNLGNQLIHTSTNDMRYISNIKEEEEETREATHQLI